MFSHNVHLSSTCPPHYQFESFTLHSYKEDISQESYYAGTSQYCNNFDIMFESLGISKWRLTSKTKEMICNSLKVNKKWTWKRKNSQILKMMTHRCGVNEECKKYKVHMVIQRIGTLENWG